MGEGRGIGEGRGNGRDILPYLKGKERRGFFKEGDDKGLRMNVGEKFSVGFTTGPRRTCKLRLQCNPTKSGLRSLGFGRLRQFMFLGKNRLEFNRTLSIHILTV